ncbi:hypothetical protein N9E35_01535 [Candidatus Marinimicrobia bacterium]|jgi:hypothetical protein|nr:hypothetical protein [Candidatus Neomarinimicrobiota bacterium]
MQTVPITVRKCTDTGGGINKQRRNDVPLRSLTPTDRMVFTFAPRLKYGRSRPSQKSFQLAHRDATKSIKRSELLFGDRSQQYPAIFNANQRNGNNCFSGHIGGNSSWMTDDH